MDEDLMFERFTDGAKKAIRRAQTEAHLLRHPTIDTAHLHCALVVDDGPAGRALGAHGWTIADARQAAGEPHQTDHLPRTDDHLPFTPAFKKILELSLRAALEQGHNWIGTEHILLAYLRHQSPEASALVALVLDGIAADRAQAMPATVQNDEPRTWTRGEIQTLMRAEILDVLMTQADLAKRGTDTAGDQPSADGDDAPANAGKS